MKADRLQYSSSAQTSNSGTRRISRAQSSSRCTVFGSPLSNLKTHRDSTLRGIVTMNKTMLGSLAMTPVVGARWC